MACLLLPHYTGTEYGGHLDSSPEPACPARPPPPRDRSSRPALLLLCSASGDITATEEASDEPMKGSAHNRHVQGALLGDALSSVAAGLGTVMPNTTFSQVRCIRASERQ